MKTLRIIALGGLAALLASGCRMEVWEPSSGGLWPEGDAYDPAGEESLPLRVELEDFEAEVDGVEAARPELLELSGEQQGESTRFMATWAGGGRLRWANHVYLELCPIAAVMERPPGLDPRDAAYVDFRTCVDGRCLSALEGGPFDVTIEDDPQRGWRVIQARATWEDGSRANLRLRYEPLD